MEKKKYVIVNAFKDAETGEYYTRKHDPVYFTAERVESISRVEQIIGYKLIKEHNEESNLNTSDTEVPTTPEIVDIKKKKINKR